jgi:hypothetical protein
MQAEWELNGAEIAVDHALSRLQSRTQELATGLSQGCLEGYSVTSAASELEVAIAKLKGAKELLTRLQELQEI